VHSIHLDVLTYPNSLRFLRGKIATFYGQEARGDGRTGFGNHRETHPSCPPVGLKSENLAQTIFHLK
jgi:hypothetical protein